MAMDQFIKIGDLKGESADKTHKEEIDVLAWSWGMSNSGSAGMGGGGGSGKVNVQDLSFTKYIDFASTGLQLAVANGKHIAEAKLTVRKAGEKPLEYLKITMTDVLISSVSTGGSGSEDRLTENVSLNFAKIKVEYTKQDKTGAGTGTGTFAWDVKQNIKA